MRGVVRAGLLYFALTFGAGFLLGPLRILLLEPRFGVRTAELLELPVMICVTWLAARWITNRFAVSTQVASRLGMGLIAAILLLVAEFALVLPLRGLAIDDYLAARDPVSGAAYYAAVLLLAAMPLLLNRRPPDARRQD